MSTIYTEATEGLGLKVNGLSSFAKDVVLITLTEPEGENFLVYLFVSPVMMELIKH